MPHSATEQAIAAARAYESLHVPAIFAQWPSKVLAAAQVRPGQRVLDVACGTGVLARAAAEAVGPGGRVTGLDANPGMLAVAEHLSPEVTWKQGLAESLPFPDGSFDVVVSQFALMFFRDRPAAIREMCRVLSSGCTLAVAVWDSLEHSELYPEEVALLEEMAGPEAGAAIRAPFVFGDTVELASLFEKAGVRQVGVTTHHGRARFPSVRSLVEADLRGWLPIWDVHLDDEHIERILTRAEDVFARWTTPNGSLEFDSPAHIVTGRVP